uniref:Uncharacterized protein n=1 Tax=Pelusios castaneus TaxID=367368 RepID=A0A8C8S2H5_9SAUR
SGEGTRDLDGRQHEGELRDKAILQQKRHLKQATQFVHKDSADLLPLDGLKRLGTSKDLVSQVGPSSELAAHLLLGPLTAWGLRRAPASRTPKAASVPSFGFALIHFPRGCVRASTRVRGSASAVWGEAGGQGMISRGMYNKERE